MSNAAHNPGPWSIAIDAEDFISVFDADGDLVANVFVECADLIAAAPDLLAALIDIRRRFHNACLTTGSGAEFVALSTPDADIAIARATGSAQ